MPAADVTTAAPDDRPVTPSSDDQRFSLRDATVPRWLRWMTLVGLALVAISRSPYIFRHGRFWGEEGAIHFRFMVSQPFPRNIAFVQARAGYYNAFADWGTWLASLVPLRYAPLVTVWLSFGALLVVVWVALAWPSDLLPNVATKLAAATLIVVGTLAITEVWVNTINTQTYLAIGTLMVLFVRVDELERWRFAIGVPLLLVAGFSGLYSVALAPLFIVCALLDRNRRRWIYAGVLTAMGVIQAAILLNNRVNHKVAGSKLAMPTAGSLFRGLAGWHIDGLLLRHTKIGPWETAATKGNSSAEFHIAVVATIFVVFMIVLLWTSNAHRVTYLLLAAFALIELLVQVGDLTGDAGGRYAVVPVAFLTLLLIHGTATSRVPLLRWAGIGVLTLVLITGLSEFWSVNRQDLACKHCPNWSVQAQRYEHGGSRYLFIWPYRKIWVVKMPRRTPGQAMPHGGVGSHPF